MFLVRAKLFGAQQLNIFSYNLFYLNSPGKALMAPLGKHWNCVIANDDSCHFKLF